MKKGISMVLVFALVISICLFGSTGIQAADTASDTVVEYLVEGGSIYFNTLTGAVTGCDESVTAADIPAEIEGVKVVEIGDSTFYGHWNLENVTIPDSITTIAPYAFAYCTSLENLTFPEGLKTIGEAAFLECGSLTEIKIPDSVVTIDHSAFACCTNLTSAILGKNVKTIGSDAFAACVSLSNIEIPNSATKLGSAAFSYCHSLTSVTIPDGITILDISVFRHCDSLTNVKIGNGVTLIEKGAFEYCGSLESVTIPNGVTKIYNNAFRYCDNLKDIYYYGLEAQWHEISKEGNDFTGVTIHFDPCGRFSDMPETSNWAYDGIVYCVENGMMNGTSNTSFNPNGTVSRAQLVTILYRAAGSPETEFKGTFTDVPAGQWYSEAIEWAAANGVVNGIGDGKFGPDQNITREQIATILYRYEKEPAVTGSLNSFPDHGKVSTFAANAMIWATQEELINGISSSGVTTLAPQNNATRAQIASIIMRYLEAE